MGESSTRYNKPITVSQVASEQTRGRVFVVQQYMPLMVPRDGVVFSLLGSRVFVLVRIGR